MHLNHGLHLAYCTNIHRGQSWEETFAALETHTLAVRQQVAPGQPYAIGLRLSAQAARQLSDPATLQSFQHWLGRHDCYVFTINGFPYGQFHGARVKEQVYAPDWTTRERLDYTCLLFDLLGQLVPPDMEGSVSTVPGSFKAFIQNDAQVAAMRRHLWQCIHHVARLSERTGRKLHLGLEPEPLCFLETSRETADFFDQLRDDHPKDPRLHDHLGVNYDTCHLAVEFEEPRAAIQRLESHQVRLSKIHLSSALRVQPTPDIRKALAAYADDIYFHQVVERGPDGALRRYRDLDQALAKPPAPSPAELPEWRIHFHIPLHCHPGSGFQDTTDHILGVLDLLKERPYRCSHLEMETYTWEVLPPELKNRSVEDQLVAEYRWTLDHLAQRGLVTRSDLAQAKP